MCRFHTSLDRAIEICEEEEEGSWGFFTMLSTLRRCYASSSSSPVPLYYNVCSSLEEESLINYFNNTIFNRKKYEGEHWDDVIHRYKETELVGYAHKVP